MKYWKNLMNGVVVKANEKPAGEGLWVEKTEQDYIKYQMHISYVMACLDKAVAYKKRLLCVE
jgi:hypothetical protein